ncbi:hypothetical protein [Mesorhizobium sp. CN2-181]|uniref:hypothetical protein n=1 Tax=Mesorhizobium yinganensis TaxID=3157707 RepID=UPI0032B7325C
MTRHASLPTTEQIFIERAVRHVHRARGHLLAASIAVEVAGFECVAIDNLHADTTDLLDDWRGRRRPPAVENLPSHITDAAADWRRQNRRTY